MVAMIRWSIRSEKCRQSTAGDFNDSGRLPGLSLRLDEDRPLGRLRKEVAVAFTAARFWLGLMEDEIIQDMFFTWSPILDVSRSADNVAAGHPELPSAKL